MIEAANNLSIYDEVDKLCEDDYDDSIDTMQLEEGDESMLVSILFS
jgi:hypothetical protein